MSYSRPLRLLVSLVIINSLIACAPAIVELPTATSIAAVAKPTSTETAAPTVIPTRTSTAAPTHTPTNTPEPTDTPSPTPGPIKPILLEFGVSGGDGGTSYDVFSGREMPSLVLYTDGQLLIGGFSYLEPGGYFQKTLSIPEMCTLLKRVGATGFFDVKGTGALYPDDPIYQTSKYFGDGANDYFLQVNDSSNKWVFIYGPAVDNLIPQVKAAYELVSRYHPSGMKSFVSDRIILRIERQPGEDWFGPTPSLSQPWPSNLPSLTALLKDQPEGRQVVFQGQAAMRMLQLMHLPGSGLFAENGETYFVVGRPLLPHETLEYFSVLRPASAFVLPFKCNG